MKEQIFANAEFASLAYVNMQIGADGGLHFPETESLEFKELDKNPVRQELAKEYKNLEVKIKRIVVKDQTTFPSGLTVTIFEYVDEAGETSTKIAIRGTQEFSDYLTDAVLATGTLPKQSVDLVKYLDRVFTTKGMLSGNVDIVGHSLGGYLAEMATLWSLHKGYAIRSSYAYNAPGIAGDNGIKIWKVSPMTSATLAAAGIVESFDWETLAEMGRLTANPSQDIVDRYADTMVHVDMTSPLSNNRIENLGEDIAENKVTRYDFYGFDHWIDTFCGVYEMNLTLAEKLGLETDDASLAALSHQLGLNVANRRKIRELQDGDETIGENNVDTFYIYHGGMVRITELDGGADVLLLDGYDLGNAVITLLEPDGKIARIDFGNGNVLETNIGFLERIVSKDSAAGTFKIHEVDQIAWAEARSGNIPAEDLGTVFKTRVQGEIPVDGSADAAGTQPVPIVDLMADGWSTVVASSAGENRYVVDISGASADNRLLCVARAGKERTEVDLVGDQLLATRPKFYFEGEDLVIDLIAQGTGETSPMGGADGELVARIRYAGGAFGFGLGYGREPSPVEPSEPETGEPDMSSGSSLVAKLRAFLSGNRSVADVCNIGTSDNPSYAILSGISFAAPGTEDDKTAETAADGFCHYDDPEIRSLSSTRESTAGLDGWAAVKAAYGDDILPGTPGDDMYAVPDGDSVVAGTGGKDWLIADTVLAAARAEDDLLVMTDSGTVRVIGQFDGDGVVEGVRDDDRYLSRAALAAMIDRMVEFTAPGGSAGDALVSASRDDGYRSLVDSLWLDS